MRAGDRPRDCYSFDWEAIAEAGDDEYIRQQIRAREQPSEPHRFDFCFDASWRRGGYVDPATPDMIDAAWR